VVGSTMSERKAEKKEKKRREKIAKLRERLE
jgi:hypothetical protein